MTEGPHVFVLVGAADLLLAFGVALDVLRNCVLEWLHAELHTAHVGVGAIRARFSSTPAGHQSGIEDLGRSSADNGSECTADGENGKEEHSGL